MPALGLGVFQSPPEETTARRRDRAARRLPADRHRRRLRQRARGRRRGARLGPRPLRGVPGDQDLDLRLRLRRDAARVREERGQARRRADRPADPPPGAALGVRPHPRGLPRPGDAAGRRQGPRDRRQQLHGRPPHRGCSTAPTVVPAVNQIELHPYFVAARGPGLRRRARHPDAGVVADRRHHLLPRRRAHQHRSRTRSSSRSPRRTARAPPRSCCAGASSTDARSSRSPPSPSASPRTSTSSTSSSPPTRWPRSTGWTPAAAAGRSPTAITLEAFGRDIPEA